MSDSTNHSEQFATLREQGTTLEPRLELLSLQVRHTEEHAMDTPQQTLHPPTTHMLPDDILLDIFEATYMHHFPHCQDYYLRAQDSPICFSHVSRRFRHVALASPETWACIHVTPGQPTSHESVIKTHLSNSRARPLNIVFQCYSNIEKTNKWLEAEWPRFATCWTSMVAHSHRWKHAAICFPLDWQAEAAIRELAEAGPLFCLQSLYIRTPFDLASYEEKGLLCSRLVLDTPVLEDLRMYSISPDPTCSLFRNITRLAFCLIIMTTNDLVWVLRQCAGTITHLLLDAADLIEDREFLQEPLSPVNLPVLSHLSINVNHPQWSDLFGVLSWPNLQSLAVHLYYEPMTTFAEALEGPSSVFSTVRFLSVLGYCEAEIPTPFIRAFPALRHLKLEAGVFSTMEDVLKAARTIDRDSGPNARYWPNLRTLTIVPGETPVRSNWSLLSAFLDYRRSQDRPIQLVRFKVLPSCAPGLPSPAIARINDLGISTTVKTESSSYVSASFAHFGWWDDKTDTPQFSPYEDSDDDEN